MKIFGRLRNLCIVFIIMGIALIGVTIKDFVNYNTGNIIDVQDIDLENIKGGQLVNGNLDNIIDAVAYGETIDEHDNVKSTTYYYISELDNCYIIVATSSTNINSDFEGLIDDTYDYVDGITDSLPSYPINAKVQPMEDDLKPLVDEYFQECGFTQEEQNEMLSPYVIQTYEPKYLNTFMILGGIAIIVGIAGTVIFTKLR